jgi:hypothetical protein
MNMKMGLLSLIAGLIPAACTVGNQPADPPGPIPTPTSGEVISPEPSPTFESTDYEIVTLLPFDAIPSIDEPRFYEAEEADQEYEDHELVIGVVVDGEARAYPIDLLSRHEIVNDTIAGHPIAITW